MALADSRERSEGEVSEVVCWTTFGQWTTFLGGLKGTRKNFPPVFHYLGLSIYFFIPFKKFKFNKRSYSATNSLCQKVIY